MVRCPKAVALRYEMRNIWLLPNEEEFLLLSRMNEEMGAHILLFWRAWYLRNNIVHGDGLCMVTGSAKFLSNMGDSLDVATRKNVADDKGKGKSLRKDVRPRKAPRGYRCYTQVLV
jgi:hypothetical protein